MEPGRRRIGPARSACLILCFTWTFTVSSEMKSCSAMSRFQLPPATCRSSSISRAVSWSSPVCSASFCATWWRNALFSRMDLANRLRQILGRHALQHVGASPPFESALNLDVASNVVSMMMTGFREVRPDGDDRVDTAHVGKAEIHQGHVRRVNTKLLDGFEAGRRFAHERHIGLTLIWLYSPFPTT